MPRGIYPRTEEYRAKMSAAHKGKVLSEEHKAKIGVASKGYKHSAEAKAKMSAARAGCKLSEEHKAAISTAKKGKPLSKEHKVKLSVVRMGKTHSKGTKAIISAIQKGNQNALGHKHSAKTKAKMSAIKKAYAQTPRGRDQLARAQQAACAATPTKLEKALYKMLDAFGWEYDTEVAFAPYIVDAYIPGLHLALEADGAFHFEGNPFKSTTPEQEFEETKARDIYLQEHYDLEVWHFTKEMLMSKDNKNCFAIRGETICQT